MADSDLLDLIARLGTGALQNELATTSQATVASLTPTTNGRFVVFASITVTTAATTVTLSCSWTDPQAGAQSYTWENATNLPVGVRLELPLLIACQAGTAIQVLATAGTANQVYVTADILRRG